MIKTKIGGSSLAIKLQCFDEKSEGKNGKISSVWRNKIKVLHRNIVKDRCLVALGIIVWRRRIIF